MIDIRATRSPVIPAKAGIQYAAASRFYHWRSGILGRPVKPGDDTLCTCGDLPVGLVELRGQVAPRNDVGEHRSPDGANGSARSAARRQAPRNPGLTRCRPRIAHRSIRATAACARGVICPSGGLLTGVSSLFFGFSEKYLLPPDPNQI